MSCLLVMVQADQDHRDELELSRPNTAEVTNRRNTAQSYTAILGDE